MKSRNQQSFNDLTLARNTALSLLAKGQKVRVNWGTNGGFHSFESWPIVLWGSAVRNPMDESQILSATSSEQADSQDRLAIRLREAVRNGD